MIDGLLRSIPAQGPGPNGLVERFGLSMGNVLTISLFLGFGVFFVVFNMMMGKLLRPRIGFGEKSATYECGERPIGPSWVQFDLRFYIVALIFLVFDVEVALFYPWATVFQQMKGPALVESLTFFVILLVGYAYLWRFGYLEWVRTTVTRKVSAMPGSEGASVRELSALARRDPESLEV